MSIQIKFLMAIIINCCLSLTGSAQFLGGFFNQKSTQRKYMMEQIVLYRTYLGYAKKGYNIAKDGLNTVQDIKSGEFNLHNDYYTSLKEVNPAIKNQPEVKAILDYCSGARKAMLTNSRFISNDESFTSQEKQYIAKVASGMEKDLERLIDELEMTITPGRLQMTDDERLKKIHALFKDAQNAYQFAVAFVGDTRMIKAVRTQTEAEILKSRKLYQLP